MYQKVYLKVKDSVSSASHVSITNDVSSSVAQDSYLSLTCHYITGDLSQHQQVCLHAAPFNDHHTGEHIAAMINKYFHSWNITSKVHVVVLAYNKVQV